MKTKIQATVSAFLTVGFWGIVVSMSHVRRLRTSDRIFFVTVNLRRRLVPFHTSEFAILLRVFDQSRRRLGFLLYGYVLRPDHWHALIWTSYRLTISQVIHDVKKVSAQRVQTARGTAGALWQHQFWDRFVRHEKEFGDRMVYMHLNPVRKGLVAKPEQWRWPSYNNFALDQKTAASCPVQVDYVLLPEGYRA